MGKKFTRLLSGQATKNKAEKVRKKNIEALVSLGVSRQKAKKMIRIEPTRSVRTKSGNLAARFKVIGRYDIK
jgi:Holliday junction resolvasome RuvABC DNA-binding subunit